MTKRAIADIMGYVFKTDAIALASPSGRMSKRAREAALARIRQDYLVPMAELPAAKVRKVTRPGCCPTCGAAREAVAA
jgi:hypothetical protein